MLVPAGSRFPGQPAGPSCELYTDLRLPAHRANAWTIFHERLAEEVEGCGRLSTEDGAPPRLRFVHQNLRLIARSVERQIAGRARGSPHPDRDADQPGGTPWLRPSRLVWRLVSVPVGDRPRPSR
jgi:hypothetical protein